MWPWNEAKFDPPCLSCCISLYPPTPPTHPHTPPPPPHTPPMIFYNTRAGINSTNVSPISTSAPTPTSSAQPVVPSDVASTADMLPTTPPPSQTDDPLEDNPPLALILAASVVGASLLIVAVVIMVIIVCFTKSRMRKRRHRVEEARRRANENHNHRPKPLYTEVFREPAPPVPKRTTDSLISNGTHPPNGTRPPTKPREILTYSLDVPETFRPFPPPRLVTASGSGSVTLRAANGERGNVYDIPEAVYDASPDDYYDKVETVHTNSKKLTSSLQLPVSSLQVSRENTDFSLSCQLPSTSELSSDRDSPDYDHVYNESLEPSMLKPATSYDRSVQALPYGPVYDSPRSYKKLDAPINVSRNSIVEIRDLGVGHFGKVILAATTNLSFKDLELGENDDRNRSLLVAIKKLREDADSDLRENFEKEIKFISRMKHANVVRLLGVCRSNDPFIVMEYMENGDLHDFLLKQTLVPDSVSMIHDNEVTPLILLYMGVQIASGMRYLASRRFIHRDLATRNCLVGKDFVIKISDFGMSETLYDSLYYRVEGRLILPIRWMAYESFYGKFSVKSDVWSYGITLWEIYSLAQNEPYHEMTDEELIEDTMKADKRKLLARPETCPKKVYNVMLRCWLHEPMMRADFEEVYSRLFLVYTQMSKHFK